MGLCASNESKSDVVEQKQPPSDAVTPASEHVSGGSIALIMRSYTPASECTETGRVCSVWMFCLLQNHLS